MCRDVSGVVTPTAYAVGWKKLSLIRARHVAPSPLRGKHASRFVQSALPRRKRRALNGAVGGFAKAAQN